MNLPARMLLTVAPTQLPGTWYRAPTDESEAQTPAAKPLVAAGKTNYGSIAKPLFADPNYHGSCDPEIIWNPRKSQWFIYYTARRATRRDGTYVATPLGVTTSCDLAKWGFRGYCGFDGKKGLPDNVDTHWAPGIIVAGDQLHMFATATQISRLMNEQTRQFGERE